MWNLIKLELTSLSSLQISFHFCCRLEEEKGGKRAQMSSITPLQIQFSSNTTDFGESSKHDFISFKWNRFLSLWCFRSRDHMRCTNSISVSRFTSKDFIPITELDWNSKTFQWKQRYKYNQAKHWEAENFLHVFRFFKY
jgi:hypothetical protein